MKILCGDPTPANTFAMHAPTDKAASHWRIMPVGNGTFSVICNLTFMCVGVSHNPSRGEPACPALYYGRDLQKWEIVRVS